MKSSTFTILIVASLLSCTKKDITPDCRCDGKAYQVLTNVKASYVGGRSFVYKIPQKDQALNSFRLCEDTLLDPNWQPDTAKFNYTISGQLKASCIPPGAKTLALPIPLLVPTQIIKE
ncbi:hypothetical protein [Larkinella arboricola]|uniref:hypothetical protein n=1 Tax=Larkinella arboricola TaxID=643671 RepID=UPI0011BA940D|nr:hypothetical protein [Larkinella arboricola]